MNLHWPPLSDAWMAAPDPAQRPWHLIARPSTYAFGSTWEWWVGGVPLRDGDPLNDLGFPSIVDLEFSRRSWSYPSLLSAPPLQYLSLYNCTFPQYPPYERKEGFVVVPLALPSASLPWTHSSFRLNQCLTASVLRPRSSSSPFPPRPSYLLQCD